MRHIAQIVGTIGLLVSIVEQALPAARPTAVEKMAELGVESQTLSVTLRMDHDPVQTRGQKFEFGEVHTVLVCATEAIQSTRAQRRHAELRGRQANRL